MGLYDIVTFEIKCPTCGVEISQFQTKESDCELGKSDWHKVNNFYALCGKCGTWIEFTRKPAESIAEFDMVIESMKEV